MNPAPASAGQPVVDGLVSVIVPTYNQAAFVRETFDSVLSQEYPHIQLIITDDGSKDDTPRIIQEYVDRFPGKITPILNAQNAGIAANLNRALREANGEFVAWLGGDDLMSPTKISRQVAVLRSRPDAAGCCHDADVFESTTGRSLGLFSELYNGRRGIRDGSVELWFDSSYRMLPSTVVTRASAMPAHGFDTRLRHANDWLYFMEVFRHGQCIALNENLGRYRRHAENVTAQPAVIGSAVEEGLIALAISEARYPELHRYIAKRRVAFFMAAAAQSFAAGDLKRSSDCVKALGSLGSTLRGWMLHAGLRLFGGLVHAQLARAPYERSRAFHMLSKLIKVRL